MAGGVDDAGWLYLCPRPVRGQYVRRVEPIPPNRRTAHEWHEATLQDAGLRDMPLHSLRHTAAAAWLATGHPLMFVQRQLGHASITTTRTPRRPLRAHVPQERGGQYGSRHPTGDPALRLSGRGEPIGADCGESRRPRADGIRDACDRG
jgi:hypothetical protein